MANNSQIVPPNAWRPSRPLRWLERKVRMAKRVVSALPTAIARAGGFFSLMRKGVRALRRNGLKGLKVAIENGVRRKEARDGRVKPDVVGNLGDAFLRQIFLPSSAAVGSEYVAEDDISVKTIIKCLAFYLPQFHPIPENNRWWGKGFTEWTNVSKAVPQFVGHYQPRLPGELGFYDLRILDVQRRQMELAKKHGIHGFCYHYYWFAGKKLLDKPLKNVLDNPDLDFPFCICWANENWTRRWDGMDSEILIAQRYSSANELAFITEVAPILSDSRYIRINGKPLLVVYRVSELPDPAATAAIWRTYCRSVGIGEIYLIAAQTFGIDDPRPYGFDSAAEFPPHRLGSDLTIINNELEIANPNYDGSVVDYNEIIRKAREVRAPAYPLIRTVCPSWDNEARKPGRGYTMHHATPSNYKSWLKIACDYAWMHPIESEHMVFINAWNEWAEGAYLEPDRKYGYAYLSATAEVLQQYTHARGANEQGSSEQLTRKIVYVSHDAQFNGAQILSLNIIKTMVNVLGYQVAVILGGGGVLESEFRKYSTVYNFGSDYTSEDDQIDAINELYAKGFSVAICNTSVVGAIVKLLKQAQFTAISLIHELPSLIKSFGLESSIDDISRYADKVVFPAQFVETKFVELTGLDTEKSVVCPQGLFDDRRLDIDRTVARESVRAGLGIPSDAKVILGVGYGDLRKGIDLLPAILGPVLLHQPDTYFIWVGDRVEELAHWVCHDLQNLGIRDRIRFVDARKDIAGLYAASDIFLISSREDPFPSVVLEAMSNGLPVVGFDNAGGFSELLKQGAGIAVPYLDIGAMSQAIVQFLEDDQKRIKVGKAGRQIIDERFDFTSYVYDLLALLGHGYMKVSVVVPNYNYAKYLKARLTSVCKQSYPVYEIIILDDASTDESLKVIDAIRRGVDRPIKVIKNERNSGSAFGQWRKGVALAKSEVVWIAEADDIAASTFLERVLRGFDDKNVVLSYCQSRQIDESGKLIADDYLRYVADIDANKWKCDYVEDGIQEVSRNLAIKNTIPNVSAVVFRKAELADVLDAHMVELSKYKVAGDWFIYVNLLPKGKITFIADALNDHRRHARSVTISSFDISQLSEIIKLQAYIIDRWKIDESVRNAARAYDQKLYEQFNISDDKYPRFDNHPDLRNIATF